MLAGTHRNSRGDNELYDLSIAYDENEKPVVKWTVTWIGGESHVFVADGTVVIPPVLYPRITPEKLVDWMMERLLLSSSVMKAIDRNAILLLQPMNGSCKEKMNVAIKKTDVAFVSFCESFSKLKSPKNGLSKPLFELFFLLFPLKFLTVRGLITPF